MTGIPVFADGAAWPAPSASRKNTLRVFLIKTPHGNPPMPDGLAQDNRHAKSPAVMHGGPHRRDGLRAVRSGRRVPRVFADRTRPVPPICPGACAGIPCAWPGVLFFLRLFATAPTALFGASGEITIWQAGRQLEKRGETRGRTGFASEARCRTTVARV
jgi:hypothetical protein